MEDESYLSSVRLSFTYYSRWYFFHLDFLQVARKSYIFHKLFADVLFLLEKSIFDVLIPVANGIYQNTVYGVAAKLPFKYTGAVVLGSVREYVIIHWYFIRTTLHLKIEKILALFGNI